MKVSFYGVLSATLLFFIYIYIKKTITWHDLEKFASAQEGNGCGGECGSWNRSSPRVVTTMNRLFPSFDSMGEFFFFFSMEKLLREVP